ncbi:MAG TPA: ATP-binding protein [Clostridia bacterium]|nr:ATP-binding protein [Clostridia bacterium]
MISIRTRLVSYFMFVIIITVFILEGLLISAIRQSYYKNLEDSMTNQIKISSDLYLRYFSDSTLYENVLNNVDTFWKQSSAQVEIIDLKGNILMDSIGIPLSDVSSKSDVKEALKGKKGTWIGKVDYDTSKVMAVSYPLSSNGKKIGILRFITSLKDINKSINTIIFIFVWVGIIVILISGFVSYFLSSSVTGPVKEVTKAAEKMASGNLTVKSKKRFNDEVGQLSDTLNFMAGELLEKDNLKNNFIASVSHELRTPLTSIKGWAVTLKDTDPNDRELMLDGLDIIEKESDRLTLMVEELLDFSKFVSGRITLNKTKISPSAIIEQMYIQFMPRAKRENLELIVDCEQDLPDINSDENRLRQLFLNILDNAFRFTPAGGKIIVSAKCDGKHIAFCIKDSGCGIPQEDLPKVKEKFYKGKSSKSRNGIGLSICDEIAKLMNGKLEITSEVNKGTEVCVTLPV